MDCEAESVRHNALVFDIETIADLTAENRDAIAALAEKREMTAEAFGGLCPPLARVVCIAWLDVAAQQLGACFDRTLLAGDVPESLQVDAGAAAPELRRCALDACAGEAQLLRRFGGMVEQHFQRPNPQLVTYNGRGFDLPVLMHRSIKHRVSESSALLSRAITENRFRPLLHLDLMEVVTFSGASARWPMAAYVIGYGFRSPKAEMDGAQVWTAVQGGRMLDVVRYCAGDVIATANLLQCLHERFLPLTARRD